MRVVMGAADAMKTLQLPGPNVDSGTSIEKSLLERRSIRNYSEKDVTLGELSQLLWAAQGVTSPRGFRTAPSAGALYPLEIAIVAGRVTGLAPGVYRYEPGDHELVKISDQDSRVALWRAGLEQDAIRDAPVVLVCCAVYERTTRKYGERGIRYVHMEAGHAAQNICLQAISLGLGTVVIGAFDDKAVKQAIGLEADEWPLCIIPVGK
ncbi:MAG: SagB/ThcOx family dehydrogenase [Deltaproteobacteria bacterium]|nr:SagB/ThcOx family dehydrogenase [Deltaproteobacteria bacterium]